MGIGLILPAIDYQPSFPEGYTPGVGIIGCGTIVKSSHLRAYGKFGVKVIGVYDIRPEAIRGVQEEFGVPKVFGSLDELLDDPAIEVVDIATTPEHRVPLMRRALDAGKHILTQKPLAPTVAEAHDIVQEADRQSLKLAVNQNGRYLPPWRIETLLIEKGVIGDVLAITHLYDMKHGWTIGTHFDDMPHFVIYDFSIHRLDIIRCWMDGKTPTAIRAREFRTPNQPPEGKTPWGAWMEVVYEGEANAMVRALVARRPPARASPSGSTAQRARSAAAFSGATSSRWKREVSSRATPWMATSTSIASRRRLGSYSTRSRRTVSPTT